jgi:hypothetical protein
LRSFSLFFQISARFSVRYAGRWHLRRVMRGPAQIFVTVLPATPVHDGLRIVHFYSAAFAVGKPELRIEGAF